jgi:hypothetical protein
VKSTVCKHGRKQWQIESIVANLTPIVIRLPKSLGRIQSEPARAAPVARRPARPSVAW